MSEHEWPCESSTGSEGRVWEAGMGSERVCGDTHTHTRVDSTLLLAVVDGWKLKLLSFKAYLSAGTSEFGKLFLIKSFTRMIKQKAPRSTDKRPSGMIVLSDRAFAFTVSWL